MSLGNKIKMLQYLSSFPSIKKAIPEFYCIDNNIMNKVYNECRGENLISEFSNALKKHIPNLYNEIYRKIGDLPWIIRSSGEEDSYDDIGAGKYISVICSTPQELEDCVARVSLSGIGERAELFDRTKAIYTLNVN